MKKQQAIDSGVYEIRCLVTGDQYIGSSIRMKTRWSVHKTYLNRGRHHARLLRIAWALHGEAAFVFNVLERCAPEDRIAREQAFMDELQPVYNVAKNATNPDRGIRTPEKEARRIAALNAPEVRARRSASLKLVVRTDEWRKAQSDAAMGNTRGKGNLGHKHSAETIEKIRAAKMGQGLGRKNSPETRAQMKLTAQDRVARLGSPLANRARDPLTGRILPTAKVDAPAAEHTMFFGSSMAASDIADVIVAKAKELASEA